MLLNKLLKAIQPVQVTGESDIEITGINIDSRLVEAGRKLTVMLIYLPLLRKELLLFFAKICRRNR